MSASVTDGPVDPPLADTSAQAGSTAPGELPLTGERTIPGLDVENYWFRRHEVAYLRLAEQCAGRDVLEAGFGEGYGADLLAGVARRVIGVDYDESAVGHVQAKYPRVEAVQGNLAELPLPDASVDVVVNFQVIEHLWDQPQFVAECARVLRPGGLLLMSTPNRITFTPGSDTPINPFHTRELHAAELTELLTDGGFTVEHMLGVFHGAGLRALDAKYGGSIIDAQIERALADAPWPEELLADVAGVSSDDFDLLDAGDADIDASLDLVAIARVTKSDAAGRHHDTEAIARLTKSDAVQP